VLPGSRYDLGDTEVNVRLRNHSGWKNSFFSVQSFGKLMTVITGSVAPLRFSREGNRVMKPPCKFYMHPTLLVLF
jgi:hypothetical protein